MRRTASLIIATVIMAACIIAVIADRFDSQQAQYETLQRQLISQSERINSLINKVEANQAIISELSEQVKKNRSELDSKVSRGDVDVRRMRVTAYDLSYKSCRKYPDHPEYGITASGEPVREWYTVAAGPELSFGTKVYIPFFRDQPNKGVFVVMDRGSAVKNGCIDVYMKDHADCMEFGVKYLDAYVLKEVERK